ncbi:phospholipase B1, membrane-associated-like [Asterias rubens]|uniref:phospholipase B1, membrane-associated-like n=1 Tax=Asterias rubens TaxID=7604 RepID=UPI001455BD94|nr:phospholipase B1, membrane-associated-like [Asterias rubens]
MKLLVFLAAVIAASASMPEEPDKWQRYKSEMSQLDYVSPRKDCNEPYVHGMRFDCSITSSNDVPSSVHKLRPGDVAVIGAFGDSITAGNGALACTLLEVFIEYRGTSWSIGGDGTFDTALTLPNILRLYNPDLIGYSLGVGNVSSNTSYLNCAVPKSRSSAMPGQAEDLVKRIYADPTIDVANDWKVITLFIGGNDVCEFCKDRPNYTKEKYIERITKALDHLHDKLPRTLVNVVGLINVTQLTKQSEFICGLAHAIICSCIKNLDYNETLEVEQLTRDYQEVLRDLANSGRYDTTDDFTVVYQPFMENTQFPADENGDFDKSFMSPDCFHLSAKGHAFAAKELWNNMLQPVGHKSMEWDPFSKSLSCPTENMPYFATNKNSMIDETSTENPNRRTTPASNGKAALSPHNAIISLVAFLIISMFLH